MSELRLAKIKVSDLNDAYVDYTDNIHVFKAITDLSEERVSYLCHKIKSAYHGIDSDIHDVSDEEREAYYEKHFNLETMDRHTYEPPAKLLGKMKDVEWIIKNIIRVKFDVEDYEINV